jgi:hypothetical protein
VAGVYPFEKKFYYDNARLLESGHRWESEIAKALSLMHPAGSQEPRRFEYLPASTRQTDDAASEHLKRP